MDKLLNGLPLVNIALAEVITEEIEPKRFVFDTAQEATMEPSVNEGEEEVLRVKNKILATNRSEDLVIGYDTTLASNTLIPQLFALIDGGTLIYDAENPDKVIGYNAPKSGIPVKRQKFTLNLYTEEKDSNGDTLQYVKFGFEHCVGRPVSFTIKDGEFFVPEMVVRSRPKTCEQPIDIQFLDELPEYTEANICEE